MPDRSTSPCGSGTGLDTADLETAEADHYLTDQFADPAAQQVGTVTFGQQKKEPT